MTVTVKYLGGFSAQMSVNQELAYVLNPNTEKDASVSSGYILLTHLSEATVKVLGSVTQPVVTTTAVAEALKEKHSPLSEKLDITPFDIDHQENYPHGLLSVVETPRADDMPCCGFVLEAEGNQIYHSGPAQFDPALRDIGRTFKPNFSLLPISKNHLTDEQMVQVPMWLGSDFIVPMPVWENDSDSVDLSEVFQAVDIYSPAICRILETGESYTLEKIEETGRTVGPESRY